MTETPSRATGAWLRLGVRLLWVAMLAVAAWLGVIMALAWLVPARESVLKVWWR